MERSIHLYINLYFNINFCKYFLDFDMVVKHMMQKNRCVNIRCITYMLNSCRSREADRDEKGGGGRRNGVLLRNSLLFDVAATLHPVDVTLKNTYGI